MKPIHFYRGESLIDYCKKNPQYKYSNITKYISDKMKEDPTRPVEDIIEEVMTTKRKSYTKYIINGMNLRRYCEVNGISYDAVVQRISRAKRDEKYKDMDEEELIHMIIEKYTCPKVEELTFDTPKTLGLRLENKKD